MTSPRGTGISCSQEPLRVLFVDDEGHILDGLRRGFRTMRSAWEMHFVTSGKDALKFLAGSEVHVVVSDMRMPEMNGRELLQEVSSRYPQVLRIILSGYAEQQLLCEALPFVHRFLSKPCETDLLIDVIQRSINLRRLLNNEALQTLVSGIGELPCLPAKYQELRQSLSSENISLTEVSRVVKQDPGLSSKVLRLGASSFFTTRRNVETVESAIEVLGLETVAVLSLAIGAFELFTSKSASGFNIERCFQHSVNVGRYTTLIGEAIGLSRKSCELLYSAALFHDIGKVLLSLHCPSDYADILTHSVEQNIPLYQLERERFSVTHAELGAYLLGLWGFSEGIIELVATHHLLFKPGAEAGAGGKRETPKEAVVLYASNAIENVLSRNAGWNEIATEADTALIANGFQNFFDRWEELCRVAQSAQETEACIHDRRGAS